MQAPQTLLDMLTYKRPAYSRAEERFVNRFLMPLGCEQDVEGNVIYRIGDAPVLWSSHTDTVHKTGGRQKLRIASGRIKLAKGSKSNCLGADDTAGVWLMREMILAGVPGLYVFHAAEEIGGIGSSYIASETPELLEGIEMAIALDRRGKDSVITHQGWSRCCSDAFAEALGSALGGMLPDDRGIFTDTDNYTHIVPECTNLSVGYEFAHGWKETLDFRFLVKLRDMLVKLDTAALPIVRDPVDEIIVESMGYTWWDEIDEAFDEVGRIKLEDLWDDADDEWIVNSHRTR